MWETKLDRPGDGGASGYDRGVSETGDGYGRRSSTVHPLTPLLLDQRDPLARGRAHGEHWREEIHELATIRLALALRRGDFRDEAEVLAVAGLGAALPPAAAPRLAVHGEEWFLPATALGAAAPAGPLPIRAIGFLDRGAAAAVTPLGQATTLHRLVTHCATLEGHGAHAFRHLERLAREVPGHQVTLGEPGAVLDLLAAH